MKILLIAPPLSFDLKRRIFPRFPPYLVLSSAAQLEKAGFEVEAYDAYLECAEMQQIVREVYRSSPDLICLCPADITRFSPLETDIKIVKALKSAFPDIPVAIFGLSKEGLIKELAKALPELDFLVLGDPEEALVELAQRIKSGRNAAGITGVFARPILPEQLSGFRVIEDLDRLEPPAWHLIGLERYQFFPHRYKARSAYPVVASRGCPWGRCVFCKGVSVASSTFYRSRSPEHLVREIEDVVRGKGYTEVQFYDGNFNTETAWLSEFLRLIREKGLVFSWSCLCRVDNITAEALKLMKEAGCWNITFGLESSSQYLLDIIDKGTDLEQARNAVGMARSAGIETTGSFLLGLPGEKPRDVLDTAAFAVSIGLDYAQFFIAKWHGENPQFAGQGTLLEEWDYSQFDFRGRVFVPGAYKGLEHLKMVQREAYLKFYLHPRTVIKHLRKAGSIAGAKKLFLGMVTLLKLNKEKI